MTCSSKIVQSAMTKVHLHGQLNISHIGTIRCNEKSHVSPFAIRQNCTKQIPAASGGTAFIITLDYGEKPRDQPPPCPAMCPVFEDVRFQDIVVQGAKQAGLIQGFHAIY